MIPKKRKPLDIDSEPSDSDLENTEVDETLLEGDEAIPLRLLEPQQWDIDEELMDNGARWEYMRDSQDNV